MKNLELAGYLFALYVQDKFIAYFSKHEDAVKLGKKYYSNLELFVVPVPYFSFKENIR